MNRLIDADELERAVMSLGEDIVCDDCAYEFVNLIDAQPTIEAEPVRHGHWIPNGKWVNCSVCGVINCKQKYCGECGAKMDEVTT